MSDPVSNATQNYMVPASGGTHSVMFQDTLTNTPTTYDFRQFQLDNYTFTPQGAFVDNTANDVAAVFNIGSVDLNITIPPGAYATFNFPAPKGLVVTATGGGMLTIVFVDFPVLPQVYFGSTSSQPVNVPAAPPSGQYLMSGTPQAQGGVPYQVDGIAGAAVRVSPVAGSQIIVNPGVNPLVVQGVAGGVGLPVIGVAGTPLTVQGLGAGNSIAIQGVAGGGSVNTLVRPSTSDVVHGRIIPGTNTVSIARAAVANLRKLTFDASGNCALAAAGTALLTVFINGSAVFIVNINFPAAAGTSMSGWMRTLDLDTIGFPVTAVTTVSVSIGTALTSGGIDINAFYDA